MCGEQDVHRHHLLALYARKRKRRKLLRDTMPLVPAVANRLRFAKETFRWLAFIGAIGALLGLGVVLIKSRPEPLVIPQKDGETLTLQNFQTASHGKGRMQLRVSGDSLTLTKTRLGGPFRLGFARSLVVRHQHVETATTPASV